MRKASKVKRCIEYSSLSLSLLIFYYTIVTWTYRDRILSLRIPLSFSLSPCFFADIVHRYIHTKRQWIHLECVLYLLQLSITNDEESGWKELVAPIILWMETTSNCSYLPRWSILKKYARYWHCSQDTGSRTVANYRSTVQLANISSFLNDNLSRVHPVPAEKPKGCLPWKKSSFHYR